MTAHEGEQGDGEQGDGEKGDEARNDAEQSQGESDRPEPSEEGKKEVKRMASAYEDRPTAVMPGTDKTITGTAVHEWLDDEGNPKFGDPDEHPFAEDSGQEGEQAQEGDRKESGEAADNPKDQSDEQRESAD
ncbi:hypothetical protein [uncultured Mycobacterium sp.]|uniref:hypothetical protein n=1 Tax=uncultured Mycobacterium sp. TaxID=171292 RepID=UPI0035C9E043